MEGIIINIKKQYNVNENKEVNNETNNSIINSLKNYFNGLREYGGKFSLVESTIENVITAISYESSNSVEISKLFGVSRRRITNGKIKRNVFDQVIEKEKSEIKTYHTLNELQSSDESGADVISTDIENHYCNMMDSDEDSESLDQKSHIENSDSIRKPKTNIFYTALSPKERKIRDDKLDLGVVRDFCHDVCRLDTFASAKVYVHNYDGTFSYHQVHVRSQSIKCYYDIFQESPEYNNWQKENLRVKRKGNTVSTIIPTIKLRIILSMLHESEAKRLCKSHTNKLLQFSQSYCKPSKVSRNIDSDEKLLM